MGLRTIVVRNWFAIVLVLAIEWSSLELHRLLPALQSSAFSEGSVAVLAGAVGVFLAFRFNEAYSRWWEARTLWGGIVNASRSFARQVKSNVTEASVKGDVDSGRLESIRRDLIHGQIAWVNALRLSLRKQDVFPEVDEFLSESDAHELREARNVATVLMRMQGTKLASLFDGDAAGQIILSRFDSTLTELTALQGGVERIKHTAFPDRVAQVSRFFVWAIAVLVAVAFIDPVETLYLLEFVAIMVIVLSFKLLVELGEDLADPFENRANDTPMTSLCRTIEIDLRQMLGESEIPEPIEATGGILM